MSDHVAALLEEALPPLPPALPDWENVLARARPRGRRVTVGRRTLAVAVAALVVSAAALASSSGLRALVGFGHASGIVLTAALGNTGEVRVAARGLYIAHGRAIVVGRLVPVGHHRSFPRTVAVRWHVALRGAPSAVALAVRVHGRVRTVATLCSPCTDGDQGTLQLRTRAVQALFAGKGEALLEHPKLAAPLRLRR